MGIVKKFNRKEKEFRAGKMLAIKDLTQHIYKNVLKGKIIMLAKDINSKLKEDGKEFELDFDIIDYTLIHISSYLKDDEKFFELLSSCVYTEGEEDGIHIHQEKYNEFSDYVLNNIGLDIIYPIISEYDLRKHKTERMLEASKIIASNVLGEAQSFSKEGDL